MEMNLKNVFFRLKYVEIFGTGVRRILEAYRNADVKPNFAISDNAVMVTLPSVEYQLPLDVDEQAVLEVFAANLVLARGFHKPAICVDVHVHRIFNRLGYIKTKTPEETEFALRKKLPLKYWIDINTLMVTHGQNICKPQKPNCKICPLFNLCAKII